MYRWPQHVVKDAVMTLGSDKNCLVTLHKTAVPRLQSKENYFLSQIILILDWQSQKHSAECVVDSQIKQHGGIMLSKMHWGRWKVMKTFRATSLTLTWNGNSSWERWPDRRFDVGGARAHGESASSSAACRYRNATWSKQTAYDIIQLLDTVCCLVVSWQAVTLSPKQIKQKKNMAQWIKGMVWLKRRRSSASSSAAYRYAIVTWSHQTVCQGRVSFNSCQRWQN